MFSSSHSHFCKTFKNVSIYNYGLKIIVLILKRVWHWYGTRSLRAPHRAPGGAVEGHQGEGDHGEDVGDHADVEGHRRKPLPLGPQQLIDRLHGQHLVAVLETTTSTTTITPRETSTTSTTQTDTSTTNIT